MSIKIPEEDKAGYKKYLLNQKEVLESLDSLGFSSMAAALLFINARIKDCEALNEQV